MSALALFPNAVIVFSNTISTSSVSVKSPFITESLRMVSISIEINKKVAVDRKSCRCDHGTQCAYTCPSISAWGTGSASPPEAAPRGSASAAAPGTWQVTAPATRSMPSTTTPQILKSEAGRIANLFAFWTWNPGSKSPTDTRQSPKRAHTGRPCTWQKGPESPSCTRCSRQGCRVSFVPKTVFISWRMGAYRSK